VAGAFVAAHPSVIETLPQTRDRTSHDGGAAAFAVALSAALRAIRDDGFRRAHLTALVAAFR
jgi:7-keto-8-aminopelargonate synthetase-like enzyme